MAEKSAAELTATQLDQVRQALGIGKDVTDAALREVLSTPQGARELEQIAARQAPTGGGPGGALGVLSDIGGAFVQGSKQLGQDVWNVTAADKPGEAVAQKLGIVKKPP